MIFERVGSPPFLFNLRSKGYAAILNFCLGVMPPMPILAVWPSDRVDKVDYPVISLR